MTSITIHNVETNEIEIRDLTDVELTNLEKVKSENQLRQQSEATKASEKAALLAKLGITEEEATLLLGGN
jgi:hypothetical protein